LSPIVPADRQMRESAVPAVSRFSWPDPWRLVRPLVAVLIAIVLVGILRNYPRYFPADFTAEFLRGRQSHFFNGYQWAFYAHVIAGPICLALSVLLTSDRLRRRFPQWHRRLGRLVGVVVLSVLLPSGLWMAFYAISGWVAGVGFAVLSLATAMTIACGWRSAVARRFMAHQVWMERTVILLCSAIVLRLITALATLAGLDSPWLYPASVWASWIVPLGIHTAICHAGTPRQERESVLTR
jgi:hypothetical protein